MVSTDDANRHCGLHKKALGREGEGQPTYCALPVRVALVCSVLTMKIIFIAIHDEGCSSSLQAQELMHYPAYSCCSHCREFF